MSLLANLTFAAILGSGLMAGTFVAFSTFIVGALRDLLPEEGAAMRSINAWNRYPVRWSLWNHLRIAASLLALWAFTMSFMDQSHAYDYEYGLRRMDRPVRNVRSHW